MSAPTRASEIIGQPLSGVAFVQDYVELHFDGKILRMLANPSIASDRGRFAFPEAGSRDALCDLVGRSVVNLVVRETEFIEVRFDGNVTVRVSLADTDRPGPEAAHFVPGDNLPIEVW